MPSLAQAGRDHLAVEYPYALLDLPGAGITAIVG